MRVFAGPNGAGKSTIINSVRKYRVNNLPVDFGIYINADDIAVALREGAFTFGTYHAHGTANEFHEIALASGLVGGDFNEHEFNNCYALENNRVKLRVASSDEHLAQILADFLRKKLLVERKKFSFETVFSHSSQLEIMRAAVDAGYKVYLYFVSTEDPAINNYRIRVRVKQGGHNVPPTVVEKRYYRSLDLLYDAAQLAYQAFFFDNSNDDFNLFAHFKSVDGEKDWDEINEAEIPQWFIKYYVNKIVTG